MRSNPWIRHVQSYHKSHSNVPYGRCMKLARATYGSGSASDTITYKRGSMNDELLVAWQKRSMCPRAGSITILVVGPHSKAIIEIEEREIFYVLSATFDKDSKLEKEETFRKIETKKVPKSIEVHEDVSFIGALPAALSIENIERGNEIFPQSTSTPTKKSMDLVGEEIHVRYGTRQNTIRMTGTIRVCFEVGYDGVIYANISDKKHKLFDAYSAPTRTARKSAPSLRSRRPSRPPRSAA